MSFAALLQSLEYNKTGFFLLLGEVARTEHFVKVNIFFLGDQLF